MRTDKEVVLTKLISNHNNLSRDRYTGWIVDKPYVGLSFDMHTRESGQLRTTSVKTIRFIDENALEFDTKNSTYKLEFVKNNDDAVVLDETENALLHVLLIRRIFGKKEVIDTLQKLVKKLYGENNA